jgi:hypothetical protein
MSNGRISRPETEDKPLLEEHRNILRHLVRRVIRAFYPPEYIVIMDLLSVQNFIS